MKKQHQQGSMMAVVVTCLTLILFVALGWVFYQNFVDKPNEQKTTQESVTQKEEVQPAQILTIKMPSGTVSTYPSLTYKEGARDTASVIDDIVSFTQPSDWRPDGDITPGGCELDTGNKDCLGQTMIVPVDQDNDEAEYPDYFVLVVSAIKSTDSPKAIFSKIGQEATLSGLGQDSDEAAEDAYRDFVTTEGLKGFKYDFESTSPSEANGNAYVTHVAYGVSNGTYVALFDVTYFNRSHGTYANKDNIDYGKYAAAVEQIAKTIHISEQ